MPQPRCLLVSSLRIAGIACLGIACAGIPTVGPRAPFDFALIGDMPYTPDDLLAFDRLVRDVNESRPRVEWVVHVGDVRGGGDSPCTDQILGRRYALMQRFETAFVFTPGDNDYLDCRDFDPVERLAHLRRLFFPRPDRTTGGWPMTVESQSARAGYEAFVENVMWTKGGVVFATVHALGVDRLPDPRPELTRDRNAAAVAWIEAIFERAERIGSPGVFLAMQADPWMVTGPPKATRLLCRGAPGAESPCLAPRPGVEPVQAALEREATRFGRPVVVATGDLHFFRVDQPVLVTRTLGDEDPRTLENLTRVEAFGSPYIHWVRIGVDPRDRDVFSFHPEVIPENRLPPVRTSEES
ncbi:MAG: hypothetical protein R3F35_07085 [Myxococcota bacterium]